MSERQEVQLNNIRSEPLDYKAMVVQHLAQIGRVAPAMLKSGKGLEKNEVYALYVWVRILHAFVAPYAPPDYAPKTVKLSELAIKEDRYELVDRLISWLEEAVKQFGRLGVLPPLPVYGEVNNPDWDTDW